MRLRVSCALLIEFNKTDRETFESLDLTFHSQRKARSKRFSEICLGGTRIHFILLEQALAAEIFQLRFSARLFLLGNPFMKIRLKRQRKPDHQQGKKKEASQSLR